MLITERDKRIVDWLEEMKVAKSGQIERVFFRGNSQSKILCNRRLLRLYKGKVIKRDRAFINTEFIYYTKKIQQVDHSLYVTEFYTQLVGLGGEVLAFETEKSLDSLRPDALCDYLHTNGKVYQMFVEVHLSTLPFDQGKYENYYQSGKWRQQFDTFPRIILATDRNIQLKESKLRYFKIPLSFKGIETIFRI
jgi:hypothetical protein